MTAALLPLVMMIGHILEERSLLGSQEAIRALSRLTEARPAASRQQARSKRSRPALRVGDLIEVRAGDRIPADGVVESGRSSVDTASITGESVPVDVEPGADVVQRLDQSRRPALRAPDPSVGEETTLGRVIGLMQEAEQAKPPVTRLLERYAQRYMVLVLLLAAATWFVTGSTAAMLAVLVASCPCALVLAAPATSIAAIAVASRHGILVKGAAFLEKLATVDAVVFDKTGTVTIGQLRLVEARPEPGVEASDLTELAGNLGAASSHPVSRALAALVPEPSGLTSPTLKETRGLGMLGRLDGNETVALGRMELFDELGLQSSPAARPQRSDRRRLAWPRFLGWLLLADELRPEAREAVDNLGISV